MVTLSKEAAGWYVSFSCAQVPIEPLPLTGKATGIDVGLKVLLLTAEGAPVENPRYYRTAERALKKAQQRVSRRKQGSKGEPPPPQSRGAVCEAAAAHTPAAQRLSPQDGAHVGAPLRRGLCRGDPARQPEPPSCAQSRTSTAPMSTLGPATRRAATSACTTLGGTTSSRSVRTRQHAPASAWQRSIQRIPRRTVQAVASACRSPCVCAPTSARTADSCWTAI